MTPDRDARVEPANGNPLDRLFARFFGFLEARTDGEKLVAIISIAVAIGYWEFLLLLHGLWFADAADHPIARDFVAFWTAGREALQGVALAAYDPVKQRAAEAVTMGGHQGGALGWWYPPLFLLVAALLACAPYAVSFLTWVVSTALVHAAVVAKIARRRMAFAVALAAPWALMVIWQGQNGFFSAGLFGLVLLTLEERPAVAGLLLGLLSYKPQLGILFPFALAAGGYWRGFAWAVAGTFFWNGIAAAVFGVGIFAAFIHGLGFAAQAHFAGGGAEYSFLQSPYGVIRTFGGAPLVAWTAQACLSLAVVVATIAVWRSRVSYSLKAAVLASGAVLATPYVFLADFPILAVALAFLYREAAFDRAELRLLGVAALSAYGYFLFPPAPFAASVSIAIIVARRTRREFGSARGLKHSA